MAGWPDTTGWLTCPQPVLQCHPVKPWHFPSPNVIVPKVVHIIIIYHQYRSVVLYLSREITLSGFQLMSQVKNVHGRIITQLPRTGKICQEFISYEVILGDIVWVPIRLSTTRELKLSSTTRLIPLEMAVSSSLLFLALNCYNHVQNTIRSFIILSIKNANQLFL